jgi:hypothetical protein
MRSRGARRDAHRGRRQKDVAGIRRQSAATDDSIFTLGCRFGDEEAIETSGGCAARRREPHGDLGFVPWHPDAASRRGNTGVGGALLGSRRRRCARAREAEKGSRGARRSRRRSFKGAEPLALRGTHAKAKLGGGGAGRVSPSLSWPDGPRRA